MKRPVILIIMDGWGVGPATDGNPLHATRLPTLEWVAQNYPVTSLEASGIGVGLPWGEAGSSEVGHLTMGAGKVIYQYYPLISLAVRDGSFFSRPALKDAFAHARANTGSTLHIAGTLSKANTHSSLEHLQAIIKMAAAEGVSNIMLHFFADGVDSPPGTTRDLLKMFPKESLGTMIGRYYALDRDLNWQLTQSAYDLLVGRAGIISPDFTLPLEAAVLRSKSEQFLPGVRTSKEAHIKDGDTLIFFNFRDDGMRQLSSAFIDPAFATFPVEHFSDLFVATMTPYGGNPPERIAFLPDTVKTPLGKVISDAGLAQMRLAETYRYAHVTYYFNGYNEAAYPGEFRVIVPSLQTPKIDENPKMQSAAITDRFIQAIEGQGFAFILINFANADTMAHTGNYNAAVAAIQEVDAQINRIIKASEPFDPFILITSDHGNVEMMFDSTTGRADTGHKKNPVPFYLIAKEYIGKTFFNGDNLLASTAGSLADVAPTVLALLGIKKPDEMTGISLLSSLE